MSFVFNPDSGYGEDPYTEALKKHLQNPIVLDVCKKYLKLSDLRNCKEVVVFSISEIFTIKRLLISDVSFCMTTNTVTINYYTPEGGIFPLSLCRDYGTYGKHWFIKRAI